LAPALCFGGILAEKVSLINNMKYF